jgi:tRNA(Arg) A34 adenosine deaminase TadA
LTISPIVAALDLERFMREALAEAGRAGDRPIGAVVVHQGEVIARGRSRNRTGSSQPAHAELEALLALEGAKSGPATIRTPSSSRRSSRARCASALVMSDVPTSSSAAMMRSSTRT